MRNTALRVFSVSALGAFVGLLSVSQVALAGDTTISVLGLEPAAGAPEAISSAVTESLRQRVTTTPGYKLIPGRDLIEVKLVFSCPDEAPPCMTQAAQNIGTMKLLFGNVQPIGTDAFLVTLKLLDTERGVIESWISEQITKAQISPAALRIPVQKWFATLSGQAIPGTIKITGGVVGAGVWIDGVQSGLLGADGLTISGIGVGPHQVVISKIGYEKFEHNVVMNAGALEKVAVRLKAIEGSHVETGPSSKPAGVDLTPPTGADQGSTEAVASPEQGSRIAAWALLGVGMVSIGFGAYSSFKVADINSKLDPYRRYPCRTGGAQECNASGTENLGALKPNQLAYIKDQQDTGDTYSKLQWIGYGVGGALLITSGVFFYKGYFSPSSDVAKNRSRLIVMPSIAPSSAGGVAYLTF
jgi:hypothetical protein